MMEQGEGEWVTTNNPDDYMGYCVDLAERLSSKMKFDYDFVFPEDGQYGARQKNGSWNGLVGDLSNGVRRGEKKGVFVGL